MKIILTIDVPDRGSPDQDALASILEHSTLRDCLETALGADVSIEGDISTSLDYPGDRNGRRCPYCGGLAESSGEMTYDARTAWQDCKCSKCGEGWKDEYRLIGWQPYMKFVRVTPDELSSRGYIEVANQNGQGEVLLRNLEGDLEVFKIHDGFSGMMVSTDDGRVLEFCRMF